MSSQDLNLILSARSFRATAHANWITVHPDIASSILKVPAGQVPWTLTPLPVPGREGKTLWQVWVISNQVPLASVQLLEN